MVVVSINAHVNSALGFYIVGAYETSPLMKH
jgi:hypothetical protein